MLFFKSYFQDFEAGEGDHLLFLVMAYIIVCIQPPGRSEENMSELPPPPYPPRTSTEILLPPDDAPPPPRPPKPETMSPPPPPPPPDESEEATSQREPFSPSGQGHEDVKDSQDADARCVNVEQFCHIMHHYLESYYYYSSPMSKQLEPTPVMIAGDRESSHDSTTSTTSGLDALDATMREIKDSLEEIVLAESVTPTPRQAQTSTQEEEEEDSDSDDEDDGG